MKAKYPYDIVTLKNHYFSHVQAPFFKKYEETLTFWRHLGESISEIHFENTDRPEMYKILYEMPKIQKCVIAGNLDKATEFLSEMQGENPDQELFKNLKTIEIGGCCLDSSEKILKNVTKLRKIMPSNAEMIISTADVKTMVPLEEIFLVLQQVRIKNLKINLDNWKLRNFLDTYNLNFESMELSFPKDMTSDSFKTLVDKHQNTNDVCLQLNFSMTPFSFAQITKINFNALNNYSNDPTQSLKCLEVLVNLQSLVMELSDRKCVFGHQVIDLPKLKKFRSFWYRISCKNCLIALANSFPNLNEFDCTVHTDDFPPILGIMFKNWRYLKVIVLRMDTFTLKHFEKSVENLREERNLRTLKIFADTVTGLSPKTLVTFQKISKVFPHLNSLHMDFEKKANIEDVVKGILPAFKELTTLDLSNAKTFDSVKKEANRNAVLKHLEQNGPSLRVSRIDI